MSRFLGIDTSNYTTSAAIYDDGVIAANCKKLLPVDEGECGLMQSKALFCHVKQLGEVVGAAFESSPGEIDGVCVSARPRNVDGSYMPVFLAGQAVAESVAASHNVPCYHSAHQVGHILSALYSAGRLDLASEPFYAFHLSGGTTECLKVTPDEDEIIKCEIVARSLDLKAGQAVDRIGVMMGLGFPAGAMMDKLAQSGNLKTAPRPTIMGCDCSLSGLENKCEKMYRDGESMENVARYAIEYIYETVRAMTAAVHDKYGALPTVYAGGVMSNSIISSRLTAMGGIFARPEYSSDNAAGQAIAAAMFYKK